MSEGLSDGRQLSEVIGVKSLEFEATLAACEPKLFPGAYEGFRTLVADYIDELPSSARTTGVESDALAESPSSAIVENFFKADEQLTSEGIRNADKHASRLSTTIRREFEACGVDLYMNDENYDTLRSALSKLDDARLKALKMVSDKSTRYRMLMSLCAGQTDVLSRELEERMTDALVEYVDGIATSPDMPNPPRRLFAAPEAKEAYPSWVESKLQLIEAPLPSREDVLTEYFSSADAAFRRAVYGYRELNLTNGLQSDSTEQIDQFQRRYFEDLGSQYWISLTPDEWVEAYLENYTHTLLYGNSETASFLNGAVRNTHAYYSKTRQDRARFSYTTQYKNCNFSNPGLPEDISRETFMQSTAEVDERLDRTQSRMLGEVKLLIDATVRNVTMQERLLLIETCSSALVSMDPQSLEAGNEKSQLRVIRKMLAILHPDGDKTHEELCKKLSRAYTVLQQ